MKRLLPAVLCVVLLASFTSALAAQEAASASEKEDFHRFALSIDPFLVFGEILHASVSVALSDTFAIPVYYTGMTLSEIFDNVRMRSVSAGLRIYPGEKVHRGFYIGPFLNYTGMSKDSDNAGVLGFGLELGGMIPLGSRFFIDLGAGLIRYFSAFKDVTTVLPVYNMFFGVKL